MKHLFLPYELAVIAKEKGFNEQSCAYYLKSDKSLNFSFNASNDEYTDCLAPLYQQIVDWLREKHHIQIIVTRAVSGHYSYNLHNRDLVNYGPYTQPNYIEKSEIFLNDYYEALNKAIEEAFKLI